MIEHFWERWRREYITELREVQRVHHRGGEQIQEGDVVLVFEEKVPRHNWRIAKVNELIPGTDGKVRGATVKIGKTGSYIQRPINKLYPFVQRNDPNASNDDIHSIFKSPNSSSDTNDVSGNEITDKRQPSKRQNAQQLVMPKYENTRGARREATIIGELRCKLGKN